MQVALIPNTNGRMPSKSTTMAGGYDLYAPCSGQIRLDEQHLIFLGIRVKIPVGYVGIIYCRSSLAKKHGLTIKGGVIDADYRGELGVMMQKLIQGPKNEPHFKYNMGDRIAQLVIHKILEDEPTIVDYFSDDDLINKDVKLNTIGGIIDLINKDTAHNATYDAQKMSCAPHVALVEFRNTLMAEYNADKQLFNAAKQEAQRIENNNKKVADMTNALDSAAILNVSIAADKVESAVADSENKLHNKLIKRRVKNVEPRQRPRGRQSKVKDIVTVDNLDKAIKGADTIVDVAIKAAKIIDKVVDVPDSVMNVLSVADEYTDAMKGDKNVDDMIDYLVKEKLDDTVVAFEPPKIKRQSVRRTGGFGSTGK